jgi:hypothetical protein
MVAADMSRPHAGPFSLEIEGGMSAYTAPRPALMLVSSAGTERNAIIGNDVVARQADIPIVQLNPGGTLNWKYKGEAAVRASGLHYCVVRPTGLIQDGDDEKEPYTVEFAQVLLKSVCHPYWFFYAPAAKPLSWTAHSVNLLELLP